ncbi:MAG: AAA family ATPase [Desulfuromonadaceae bacterium]|nr:AAA family ATPase [Desulfuromonadaceae bacterium]MDD5105041.1 AAA family ATPase [Desulfuromonadaceae bacterium]
MYCDFFGFSEKPFTITPNPHFVFLSSVHREAYARLLYGVDSHAGFISLTGEVGTGKTTMLRTLLSQLASDNYASALIFNPTMSAEQLLSAVCREFGVESDQQDRVGYLDALYRYLIEQNSSGRTVVLVIDEAQNLEPDVLEQVRLISNLETERDKLIQIILAGQPELNDVLGRHDLRQLNQRISVRCALTPMALDDTTRYINHRLRISGSRIPDLFSRGAIRRIYRFSHGTPRLINIVCEQALVMAWTREVAAVSSGFAAEVIRELHPAAERRGFWQSLMQWFTIGR